MIQRYAVNGGVYPADNGILAYTADHLADQVAVAKAWGEKLAELEADHLAALAEKEKQIAVLKTTIDVYKQDHVNLLDEIARRGEQIATLKEQIIIQKGMIGWRDGKIREQLEQIATLIARLHTHGDIETDIEALRGEEEE